MLGSGENSREVEESFFDRDLVQEFRATLEQAAKECGEWRPNGENKGDGERLPITVNQTVVGGSQGAIVIERQVRDNGQPWQTRQYDAIHEPTNNSSLINGLNERLAAVPAELLVEATHDSIQSRDNDLVVSEGGQVEVIEGGSDDGDAG